MSQTQQDITTEKATLEKPKQRPKRNPPFWRPSSIRQTKKKTQ